MNKDEPSKELALEIVKFLLTKSGIETSAVLAALSTVLAAIAVEAGMEEEKAVYAFRKSFGNASRKLKSFIQENLH